DLRHALTDLLVLRLDLSLLAGDGEIALVLLQLVVHPLQTLTEALELVVHPYVVVVDVRLVIAALAHCREPVLLQSAARQHIAHVPIMSLHRFTARHRRCELTRTHCHKDNRRVPLATSDRKCPSVLP